MLIREHMLRSYLLLLIIGGGLWLSLCLPMLTGSSVPGFRDSAYLYYPLFEWLDAEWSKGQVPLWNPYCNYGMSNVGDNTTSLFYPGKAVFFLRFLDFPTRYGLYISVHILLAGAGAFWFSRVLRASLPGALLAGISYGGSGVILTQSTNVIFLVSAAWLPFALASVWKMSWPKNQNSGPGWSLIAGICCAMMILGGDPQMVYHVGLVATATVASKLIVAWRKRRSRSERNLESPFVPRTSIFKPIVGLAIMVFVTSLLALVQIVPTYEWSRLSERASSDRPNLYRWIRVGLRSFQSSDSSTSGLSDKEDKTAFESRASLKSLIKPLQPETVSFANYEFSLPPWALIDLFIPNGCGRLFPTHQRWSDALSSPQGPDRVWYLSLYLGWITAWVGLNNLKFAGAGRRVWLSRIGLFFVLGSLGWYGLCWLLPIPGCGSQVGGLYWWMNFLLPGYDSFRYPAKLFVVANLCLCVLAGLRLNARRLAGMAPQRSFFCRGLAAGMIIGLIIMQTRFFTTLAQKLSNDPLFGPFDIDGCKWNLTWSLLHGLALICCLAFVCRTKSISNMSSNRSPGSRSEVFCWSLVLMTALDLSIANHWILALVPSDTFTNHSATALLSSIDASDEYGSTRTHSRLVPLAIYRKRDAFVPSSWQPVSSKNRLVEIIQWQRSTLYPKHHLRHQIRLMGSFGSIQPELYEQLLKSLDRKSYTESNAGAAEDSQLVSLCDAELSDAMGPVRLVVWNSKPKVVFLRPENKVGGNTKQIESIANLQITHFESNSVSAKITCRERCQLVHACIFDGKWKARIVSKSTGKEEIKSTTGFEPGYQGLDLDPGEYEIELTYSPRSFWVAAYVSLIGWIVTIPTAMVLGFRSRRRLRTQILAKR